MKWIFFSFDSDYQIHPKIAMMTINRLHVVAPLHWEIQMLQHSNDQSMMCIQNEVIWTHRHVAQVVVVEAVVLAEAMNHEIMCHR